MTTADHVAIKNVLAFLGVDVAKPDLPLLERLVNAYVQRVPWESAARIARRAVTARTEDCGRWPEIFWQEAQESGTGGTCFESNYAFFWLLQALGYESYLTINDMGETRGCHTAIVVYLGDGRWLVDVGIPLFTPLKIDQERLTERVTPWQHYTLRPIAERRYHVERSPHPKPIVFTLIDEPVDDATYRAALTADYGPGGLFLDRVIVNKIVDGVQWRFASSDLPYRLESFPDNTSTAHPIGGNTPESIAAAVSAKFGIAASVVRAALEAVETR